VRRRRLLWQIFAPVFVILVVSTLAISGLASWSVYQTTLASAEAHLERQAHLVEVLLEQRTPKGGKARADLLVRVLGERIDTRVTVIAPDGTVLADSAEDPSVMPNHADRPEVAQALTGSIGVALRWSATLGEDLLYLALPPSDRLGGNLVRTALAASSTSGIFGVYSGRIVAAAIVIAALGAAIALLAARRTTQPLEQLDRAARRFAGGDLSFRAPVLGVGETAQLATSLNLMAEQLDQRFRLIADERNEQEVVLSSMVEGVLAVDPDERVTTMNLAAGRLLGIEPHRALGRSIQEIARNPDIQRFVSEASKSDDVLERDITIHTPDQRSLQGHGASIVAPGGARVGTVVVLNDVTKLRRLELLRREFVANVSHELKTPITSIKGFVDTLLDGALARPDDATRFLQIVSRHADRLSTIIDDLLSLSRIEQEDSDGTVEFEVAPLYTILRRAADTCDRAAQEKRIRIAIHCDDRLQLRCNDRLLEQAIANLVENAIKYSDPESGVELSANARSSHIEISVRDHGWGIEPEHIDRLFERFYRVDKARSRKLGGTGLGLAIVKHIALAHGGTVKVTSSPGDGSTFKLMLPVAR
jgi:two-component system phosphate regulon sensor histidine kinase PhoR